MEKQEYYSRDYSFEEIDVDPRFLRCQKEMLITLSTWFAFTIISIAVAYGLGKGPVEEYTYVFGLPLWWFAAVMVTVVFTFIVIGITLFVFKDMDLADVGEIAEEEES